MDENADEDEVDLWWEIHHNGLRAAFGLSSGRRSRMTGDFRDGSVARSHGAGALWVGSQRLCPLTDPSVVPGPPRRGLV